MAILARRSRTKLSCQSFRSRGRMCRRARHREVEMKAKRETQNSKFETNSNGKVRISNFEIVSSIEFRTTGIDFRDSALDRLRPRQHGALFWQFDEFGTAGLGQSRQRIGGRTSHRR